MDQERNQNPAARSLLIGISSLYAYIYCLIVSNALTSMPVFGGAMYLCGQVALEFFSTAVGPAASLLPDRLRKWRRAILAVLMVMNLFLIVIYPIRLSSFQLWTVLVVVVAMLLRDEGARRLLQARRKGRLREVWFWFLLTLAHVLPAVAVLSDFMYNLGTNQALTMFVAYLLADALSIYVQISEALSWDDPMRDENEVAMVSEIRSRLGKANAFRTYQALSSAIVISLVSTVVLMYTYLLFSGENMLVQLGFTVLTTFLTSVAANLVFRGWMRRKNRQPNPTYVMLVGLLFWFGGLNAFDGAVMLRSKTTLNMYICLASCTVGTTLCLTSLNWMEQAIENVVRFAEGNNLSGFRMVRAAHTEMARLLGDMLALVIITVMFAISGHGPQALEDVVSHLQPILILPCLIMIFIAVICTFRFPLSTRNMDKLARFLHLREEGKENKALQSQIEQIAIAEHRQPFGTAIAKAIIRLFYPHRIRGRENIRLDDENPLVFLCNHGDIYGPTVCAAHFPVPMRPWVIAQVCTEVEDFQNYFYKYNLSKLNIPEKWKMPIAHTVGRMSIWCMRQLEAVPVYRDKPAELIKTFRATVEAMQAGDNILIFPENPNALAQDHGYEHDGLGPLFEGFTMLATIYYKRTHKACRFLPMFAHKGTRTLCFGHEVIYNPQAEDEGEERKRVVQACEQEMRRLMEEQDAKVKRRKKH